MALSHRRAVVVGVRECRCGAVCREPGTGTGRPGSWTMVSGTESARLSEYVHDERQLAGGPERRLVAKLGEALAGLGLCVEGLERHGIAGWGVGVRRYAWWGSRW